MNDENARIYNKLDDYDTRLRKLEENKTVTEFKFIELDSKISDLKSTVLDINRETMKQTEKQTEKLLNTVTELLTSKNSTENKIKLFDRKEMWVLASAIVTALISYFIK